MAIIPPQAEAIWSMSPQGLPKKRFSAAWPIMASSVASSSSLQKRPLTTAPISTSKAAEEDRPEPGSTSETA